MRLIPVTTPALAKAWVRMPVPLYRQDPHYIQPLDKDVEAIFDPAKNKKFRRGQAMRWLLDDGRGRPIGRIAAFYEEPELQKRPLAVGGMGFFDCIDEVAAARMLLEAAEAWLQAAGANVVDGPVNFGDRDRFWGCLAEGFTAPNYACNYNAPYYARLLEQNGYQDYFRQLTYYRPVAQELDPRIAVRAERIHQDPDFRFVHIPKNFDLEKVAREFHQVYNKAWGKHSGVPPMAEAHARALVKAMKPVMDHRLIWFGYHGEEPVSFFISLPELNQIFRHMHGKFGLWEKVKFLYYRHLRPVRKMFGLVYGVVPEYQGRGVESAMVHAAGKVVQKDPSMHYTEMEMNWIGDFNPKMMRIAELMGGTVSKQHITFRKILDPAIPFERMAAIR